MDDQLQEIREAIDSDDVKRARELLREPLKQPKAETYYLASQVALSDSQRVSFLEKALELDPFHEEAADALHYPNRTSFSNEEKLRPTAEHKPKVASPEISEVGVPLDTEPISWKLPIVLLFASAILSYLIFLTVNAPNSGTLGNIGNAEIISVVFLLYVFIIPLVLLIQFLRRRPQSNQWSVQLALAAVYFPFIPLFIWIFWSEGLSDSGASFYKIYLFLQSAVPLIAPWIIYSLFAAFSNGKSLNERQILPQNFQWRRPIILASLGLVVGLIFSSIVNEYVESNDYLREGDGLIISITTMVIISMGILLNFIRKGNNASLLIFTFELFVFWLAFSILVTLSYITSDFWFYPLTFLAIFWFFTTIFGVVLLFFGKPYQQAET